MSTSKSDFVSLKKQNDTFVSDDSGNFTTSVFTDGDGSHVTMLSPRVDPASTTSVGGLTEDGCYTSAVSLSDYFTAPSSPRTVEPNESYLKAIFDNFNELYQDKMAWIDENIPESDRHSHVMAKKNVLEHWVKDVIEQNNILVQTVEELEAEAEKKVQTLQKKVYESAELAKEHMGMIKEYEEQIKHLMKEKHNVEKQEEFFRKESMYLEKEKRRALDRMHTLENDNSSLLTLMNRIRDMGVWDVNGLNFTPRTYDCIFGLYPNLAGSEVQTVFTREKARNLEKAENNIAQLMAQVEELHGRKNEAERLLTEKTKITEELQHDIKDLHTKIKQYQDEHQDFKKSLKETQEQLKAATLKNQSRPSTGDTKRESEMKEMLGELRDLRNQLNIACSERQQAMKESNQLKTELQGRIVQMEDMKCLLDQIQTEAASTRNAVQDVQDKQGQMSTLKEKVSFYQTSYENSSVLLEAKSEVITRLQNQMDQLHDKMLAYDDWKRKQDVTHSDATGDRDSGHLSDFSDCWIWNGNDDDDKEIQIQPSNTKIITAGLENYETLCSLEHFQPEPPDFDRFQQILIENQRLRDEKSELERLNTHLERDKVQRIEDHKKELNLKDVEITMQKRRLNLNDGDRHHDYPKSNSDAVLKVEEKIRHTGHSCDNLKEKVMDVSKELTCFKKLAEKLHVESKLLEKHNLLYKSYVVLGQVESDRKYILGDSANTGGDSIEILDPHAESCPNTTDVNVNEWENSFQSELRQLREFAASIGNEVTEKFTHVELLKQETEEVKKMVQHLSKNFRDVILEANNDNAKLSGKIVELESKQAQMDEVLRMESEIHGMHNDIQDYDPGALLTEKRLGVIQNSYDKLSHELIRRDEMISQRDAKIAELESHIRDSDVLNQSNAVHSNTNSVSESFDFEHSIVMPNEDPNSGFSNQTSDAEKIGRLIWLVAALKKKLKKKKEREDYVVKEKEVLMNLFSNMSSTWDGLRVGCEQVRLENEQLKAKLETQSQSILVHSPRRILPSVHPHSLQAPSNPWNRQEEGDGDKMTTFNERSQGQTPSRNIDGNNNGFGRIVYPIQLQTDCSLRFPQASTSKGLSESDLPIKAPGQNARGILTVSPRNFNLNSNNSSPLISSIAASSSPQNFGSGSSLLKSDNEKAHDISFISPPKYLELDSNDSRVTMSPISRTSFPPTPAPSSHQPNLQCQFQHKEKVSPELLDLVHLWEECNAKTRQVLSLGNLSSTLQTTHSSLQQFKHESLE